MDILLSFFELSGSERRDQAKNLPHQHTYITAFYVPKKKKVNAYYSHYLA